MKRLLFAGLLALGLACTAKPAHADCSFEYSCSRHISYVHTKKNRCFNYSSYSNPLPCAPSCCGPSGPALWDGYHPSAAPAYGVPAYGVAAPVAATPSFTAPQPTPAPKGSATSTGLQQTGYFYYPPTANAGYSYGAGYGYGSGYGYGYGAGYFQAPSYWYGD